jgi:serine/threonine-protein kinase RsbW
MEVHLSLCLPGDAASVPVTRRVLRCAMTTLGVLEETRGDVELALSEACGNVVRHALHGDAYEVHVTIEGVLCTIDVVDTGRGLDGVSLAALAPPDVTAEQGRGLLLIKALTENAHLVNLPRKGSIVHFEKQLAWSPDAPIAHLR